MAKGDIYLHSNFKFADGTFGKKFFIILYEPDDIDEYPYLIIKTTSNLREGSYTIGCNDKRKAFYVPQNNVDVFPVSTLLQLQEIFEISAMEFLEGCLTSKEIEHKGKLPDLMVSQLINCIKKLKEDISEKHFYLITKK